ncbi:hypothetical protein CR513_37637, partial [Mucuna pruriens]
MRQDTQSVNVKVETLSKGRKKSVPLYENEENHDEGHINVHSGSSRFHRSVRHERPWGNEDESRKGPFDGLKCKIPQFLGEVRLVTLKFTDYALVW